MKRQVDGCLVEGTFPASQEDGPEAMDLGENQTPHTAEFPVTRSSQMGIAVGGDSPVHGVADSRGNNESYSGLQGDYAVRSGPMVIFPLLTTFQDDSALVLRYPNERERRIATMVRDIQLLTVCHTEGLLETGALKTTPGLAVDFPPLGPPLKLSDGFAAIIKTLEKLEECVISTYECPTYDNGLAGPGKVEYMPAVTPWGQWPLNKTDAYLSRLVCRYRASKPTFERHVVEIADYCLAHHQTLSIREPLFQSDGRVLVLRREMLSMEHYVPIHAAVVNAWVRVCVDNWKKVGCNTRTCFDVVHKQEGVVCRPDLVDHWRTWITNFQLNITEAELVFIPCLMYNHYSLVVVNFNTKVIQCIDTVRKSDRTTADEFVKATVGNFWDLLQKIGDIRHSLKPEFEYEVMNPFWSTTTSDPDSGLSVMHLINIHKSPHAASLNVRMQEDNVRTSLRVTMCANMVISRVNTLRVKVLGDVQQYVEKKNNRTITPSQEVELFRSNFCWLPNL